MPQASCKSPSRDEVLQPENLASVLTVVVSTSPSKAHCDAWLLKEVLQSIQNCPALRPCRKLLVFDAHAESLDDVAESGRAWVADGTAQLRHDYRQYMKAMREALEGSHPAMHAVELLQMPSWGHLGCPVASFYLFGSLVFFYQYCNVIRLLDYQGILLELFLEPL